MFVVCVEQSTEIFFEKDHRWNELGTYERDPWSEKSYKRNDG